MADDPRAGGVAYAVVHFDPPEVYLAEARRLRSGELHFFDHPAFGVLVQITPEPLPDVTELDLTTLPQRRTPLPSTTDQSS